MPSITFTSNGLKAYDLYDLSTELEGDDTMFIARRKTRKKILATWPELDGDNPEDRADEADLTTGERAARKADRLTNEKRSFGMSPEEQNAFAEGFLKMIKDTKVKDGRKELCFTLAAPCRFSGWLERQTSKSKGKAFTESDESVELDEDPAPAPESAPVEVAEAIAAE